MQILILNIWAIFRKMSKYWPEVELALDRFFTGGKIILRFAGLLELMCTFFPILRLCFQRNWQCSQPIRMYLAQVLHSLLLLIFSRVMLTRNLNSSFISEGTFECHVCTCYNPRLVIILNGNKAHSSRIVAKQNLFWTLIVYYNYSLIKLKRGLK